WAAIVVLGLAVPALRRSRPEFEPWRVGLIAVGVAWFIQANFTPLDYAFDNYVVWLWAGVAVAGIAPRRRPASVPGRRPGGPPAPAERQPVRAGPLSRARSVEPPQSPAAGNALSSSNSSRVHAGRSYACRIRSRPRRPSSVRCPGSSSNRCK